MISWVIAAVLCLQLFLWSAWTILILFHWDEKISGNKEKELKASYINKCFIFTFVVCFCAWLAII